MTTPSATPPGGSAPTTVEYKGAPLDAEKGPGLGCFWIQIVVLGIVLILTPLSVAWSWPVAVSAGLLITVLILLLFAGQTVIFLLRLVAADRRAAGRRRPLGSATKTVGEMEDDVSTPGDNGGGPGDNAGAAPGTETPDGGVRE